MIENLQLTLRGTITQIDPITERGEYKNTSYILELDDEGYKQLMTIEAFQKADADFDNVGKIHTDFKVGDLVDAEVSLRGSNKTWQGPDKGSGIPPAKAFIKLSHFKLTKVEDELAGASSIEESDAPPPF